MNKMKNIEKMIWVGAIIVASGCMHAAISHYYYNKFQQRSLEEQFVEKLILNELLEDLNNGNDGIAEPELIIKIDFQEEAVAPIKKAMIVIETQDELRDVLTNNQEPSVIFFQMNGCGWCTKMKPTYDAVAEKPEFAGIQFYSANGPELRAQDVLQEAIDVKVTGYPLFVFMNKGKFIDKQVGGATPEAFEHKIKSMFPEIFGVIAPLVQPKPAPEAPISKFITVIEDQDALKDLLTKSQDPSVIFFNMTGCGWCNKMKPVFNAAADNRVYENIKFYMANGPQLNAQNILKETIDQSVTGYPLFIFMNDGKCVDQQVGGANPENFENKIKAVFPNKIS